MQEIRIRPVQAEDHSRVEQLIVEHWGSARMVVHGDVFFPAELPGFLALSAAEICGLVTYSIRENDCEILSLDAFQSDLGIGSLLIEAVKDEARAKSCARLRLVTTNDNLNALAFYQKRGFRLSALRPGALELSRKIKPEIPLVGDNGIPIRDEIELEIDL